MPRRRKHPVRLLDSGGGPAIPGSSILPRGFPMSIPLPGPLPGPFPGPDSVPRLMTVTLDRPWLRCDLGRTRRVLSWSLNRPGFVSARHILWREVRDADLTEDLDTGRWFAGELARCGDAEAVGLLTSRDVGTWRGAAAEVEGVRA